MRALVVEDSSTIRMILCQYLQKMNIQVVEAADGREALERLKEMSPPDLVLVLRRSRSTLLVWFCAVQGDFAVHDVGEVAAFGKKLHDLVACTGELCPARGGPGILFEPADGLTRKFKVYLEQVFAWGRADRKLLPLQLDF